MKKLNNKKTKKNRKILELRKNLVYFLMVLPGFLWLILFKYLPMTGIVIAFKDFRFARGGILASLKRSKWVGFENFKFLFSSQDAWVITRNTVAYNLLFIILGLVLSVALAIGINELLNKKLAKIYQTFMFMPHFLSWVVVGYFVFSFLSVDKGMFNNILLFANKDTVSWYTETKYWPFFLTVISQWKMIGYNSIVYLAAIASIDKNYYEVAMIEGATKWQQIKYITIPQLKPLMIILTLLALGRVFSADFGLFYQVPQNSGALYPVTNVIDTYIYRGLMATGDIGMSTAAGLYQSLVGFVTIVTMNWIVNKIDSDNGLF